MTTATYHNWQNPSSTAEQYMVLLDMLERAEADNVLDDAFDEIMHDRKSGRSARMSRWAIPATNTTPVAEGVNNTSRAIVPEDKFVTLSEYTETFAYTSRADDLDPLDYASGVAEVGYDLVKLDRTAIRWAAMIAGTQVIYNSSALSARNTVNGPITIGRCDQAITILRTAKAKEFAGLTMGSNRVGSTGLMPGFKAYCHEHLRADIQRLPDFQPVSQYPSDVRVNPQEIGASNGGRIRWIISPELYAVADAGATKGNANLRSTTGTSVDVYPIIIVGKYALKGLKLKGKGSKGQGNLQTFKIDTPDRTDPANQTRYWSAKWYDGYLLANDLWMIRVEVAATAAYN